MRADASLRSAVAFGAVHLHQRVNWEFQKIGGTLLLTIYCIYIYIYIYLFIYVFIYLFIHIIYIYMFVYLNIHIRTYIYIYIHTYYIHIYMRIHTIHTVYDILRRVDLSYDDPIEKKEH